MNRNKEALHLVEKEERDEQVVEKEALHLVEKEERDKQGVEKEEVSRVLFQQQGHLDLME